MDYLRHLVAVTVVLLGSCWGEVGLGGPCTSSYKTVDDHHVNDVEMAIESIGYISDDWDLVVRMFIYSNGPDRDPLTVLDMMFYQPGCENPHVLVGGVVGPDGSLYVYPLYYTPSERCSSTVNDERIEADDLQVEGSVTYDYDEVLGGILTLGIEGLSIVVDRPDLVDEPRVISISMNGAYHAPLECIRAI